MQSKLPSHSEMVKLAQENPDALEQLRQKHVEQLIANAPPEFQRRLHGLQFQVNAKRAMHDNPMGACVEISRLMMESLNSLRNALEGNAATHNTEAATILHFNNRANIA